MVLAYGAFATLHNKDISTISTKKISIMELTITLLNGDSYPLMVEPHTTLGSLKSRINQLLRVPTERQRLSGVNGNNISLSDDSKTLSDYGLHSGSKVMVLITEPTHIQVFLKNEKGHRHTHMRWCRVRP
ncbi:hypothetical protein J4Q44_G00232320 [Coregonus suidteri]|uniref:Ubiquitin-like domain-containing protein n=1 Tax=Coregonus suidteri TaxID=861788 RepID=A0AAN8QYG6_9TELE